MCDENKSPNILIIMSDDQGPWAMNCAGTTELHTPRLDQLADQGIRFENFFCASPVCSPARASFLTGRIPSQHGIHDWIKSGNIDVEDNITWSGADQPINYLSGMTGFTDVLAQNGYICGLSGKWHLGDSATAQKSHTFWSTHSLGGDSYTNYFVFNNSREMTLQKQYVTDFFTDRAIDFLDKFSESENPFCLSVHYTAPHSPWRQEEQPSEIWNLYNDVAFDSLPSLPPHDWNGWAPSLENRRQTIQGYFTTITAMDTAIGRILDKLEGLGISEDTLIIFTSDNGYNMGHHGILGKGNGTYPLNMYEESVKVPFIACHPGRIPPSIVNKDLLSHYDFMPTILDYLGLELPPDLNLPGTSFVPVLEGKNHDGNQSVAICDEYGPTRMLREKEWKYIHRYPEGPHELYNLIEDPEENHNLVGISGYHEPLIRLRADLEKWFSQYVEVGSDGVNQPVTGRGQIDTIGINHDERVAFV